MLKYKRPRSQRALCSVKIGWVSCTNASVCYTAYFSHCGVHRDPDLWVLQWQRSYTLYAGLSRSVLPIVIQDIEIEKNCLCGTPNSLSYQSPEFLRNSRRSSRGLGSLVPLHSLADRAALSKRDKTCMQGSGLRLQAEGYSI